MKVGDVVTFYLGKNPNRYTKFGKVLKVNTTTAIILFNGVEIKRKIKRDFGMSNELILEHEKQMENNQ
jgi:hypothetical protein